MGSYYSLLTDVQKDLDGAVTAIEFSAQMMKTEALVGSLARRT